MARSGSPYDVRGRANALRIETLLGKGYAIRIYDRNVSTSRLIGANRRFMEEHIPHLSSLLVASAVELTAGVDVIVVGYQSSEFSAALLSLRADQTVIDLARLAKQVTTPARYEGICW